ncbi:MAG: lysophospholipid acyltransferase family protein [Bdellovibrionota bacterium]
MQAESISESFPPVKPVIEPELSQDYSPDFVAQVQPLIEPFYEKYFRCEVRSMERIPKSPAFLVANHNAGGIVEIPLFLHAWYRKFGPGRPLLGLAHKAVFTFPVVKDLMPKIGAIPASPENARKVLKAGKDLAVFPGGDWEASRPTAERQKIDFAGRKGFVRIALETGAPVVPLVIAGAHETGLILARSAEWAKALGLDITDRIKAVPLWAFPPVLPSKVTMECLEPIDLRKELKAFKDEEEKLRRGYDLVTSRMQEAMDHLYAERKTYWG